MRQDVPQRAYVPNRVTHPTNPLIAEKMQFFTDSLKMMCLKSGEYYHYEIENHLSLVRHIIFNIDAEIARSNTDGMKYCFKQIKHFLNVHPLLSNKDLFIIESEKKTEIINKLQEILNITYASNNELNTKLSIIRTLFVELDELIEPDYFKKIVESISQKICCTHLLNYHKKHFYYLSKISFSYYYLNGYSRKLISSFADKIFQKKLDIVGHRIYFEGYLPFDLYQKQLDNNRNGTEFNSELFDEIQSYLDDRTQPEQIDSLLHVLHYEKHERKLLFKLDGIITFPDKDDELDLLGLKIYQTNDFKKKYNSYNYESSKDFFRERQTAIVEITTNAFSQEDAVYHAIENLRDKLGRIMMLTNSRFSLSQIGYTFYPSEDETNFWINTMPEVGQISIYDVEELNYINDKLSTSTHKEFYLELEQILQEAYIEDNITTSIHYFRKFVEFLFKNINGCGVENEDGISKEIRTIAYLLTYFEKKRYQAQIRLWVDNKLINSHQLPGESNDLANEYRKLVHNKQKRSFSLILKYISPFMQHTKYEANRAYNYSKNVDEKLVFEYYCRQLLFIKQYRDKHEHSNITDDVIARKLGVYSYRILNRLLKDIFRVLADDTNNSTSHKEILKMIVQHVKNRIV